MFGEENSELASRGEGRLENKEQRTKNKGTVSLFFVCLFFVLYFGFFS